MMTGLMDKRKRSREDDFCESTPLSKRINNLHINNFEESSYHQQQDFSNSHMNGLENIPHSSNNEIHYPSPHHNGNLVPPQDNSQQYSYNPELSENENPFYYNKNKLLHELHFERVKRNQT